jgi:hypothetical protein
MGSYSECVRAQRKLPPRWAHLTPGRVEYLTQRLAPETAQTNYMAAVTA